VSAVRKGEKAGEIDRSTVTSESRAGKQPGKMMKKEKPMMSVTAIIQGTQAQHWARGNTCTYAHMSRHVPSSLS
jgi:hypothetical protein